MKTDPIGSSLVKSVAGSNDPLNLTDQKANEQQKQIDSVQAQSNANANKQYGVVSSLQTIGTA